MRCLWTVLEGRAAISQVYYFSLIGNENKNTKVTGQKHDLRSLL